MNNIDKLIEEASAEIEKIQNSASAYERRGDLFTSKGDHGLAEKDYKKAFALDPNPRLAKKQEDAFKNDLL